MDLKQSRLGKLINGDVGIFMLAVVFIGVMHSIAFEDRMVSDSLLSRCRRIGLCAGASSRHRIGLGNRLHRRSDDVRTNLLRGAT